MQFDLCGKWKRDEDTDEPEELSSGRTAAGRRRQNFLQRLTHDPDFRRIVMDALDCGPRTEYRLQRGQRASAVLALHETPKKQLWVMLSYAPEGGPVSWADIEACPYSVIRTEQPLVCFFCLLNWSRSWSVDAQLVVVIRTRF